MSYAIGHVRLIQSGVAVTTECFSDIISSITQELVNVDINIHTDTAYPTWAVRLS